MNNPMSNLTRIHVAVIRLWKLHYHKITIPLILLLITIAVPRLYYETRRLIFVEEKQAAVDLRQRHGATMLWFSGEAVYKVKNTAVYPPAFYLVFSPLIGHSSFTLVRWLWALSSYLGLIWFLSFVLRYSLADKKMEHLLLIFIILSCYATSITIGNGQITIHVLVTLVAGLIIMCQKIRSWTRDVWAGFLIIVALCKPTLSIPFMWLVLFVPSPRIRPVLIVVAGFFFFTSMASVFQPDTIISLHRDWLKKAQEGVFWNSAGGGGDLRKTKKAKNIVQTVQKPAGKLVSFMFTYDLGYGDIHSWLGAFKLSRWNFHASFLILLLLGVWIFFYRQVDVWILFGVTALVCRMWTYHRIYDDFLILLPMVTLFRLIKIERDDWYRVLSVLLLGGLVFGSVVPASLRLLPYPWDLGFKATQTALRFLTLGYLVHQAYRFKHALGLRGIKSFT